MPANGAYLVYIAAQFTEDAAELRDAFAKELIGCTSSWIDQAEIDDAYARTCQKDLRDAHAVVIINKYENEPGTGEWHTELGFALADGKPIFLLGRRTNVYHHLSHVHASETIDALVTAVKTTATLAKR